MANIVRVVTEEIYQQILKLGLLEEPPIGVEGYRMEDTEQDLLGKIPAKHQQDVKNTLEILKNKGFSWDHLGQYTFNGKFVENSDILNLTLALFTPKPNPSEEQVQFQEILHQLGLFNQEPELNQQEPTSARACDYPWKTFEDLTTFKNGA